MLEIRVNQEYNPMEQLQIGSSSPDYFTTKDLFGMRKWLIARPRQLPEIRHKVERLFLGLNYRLSNPTSGEATLSISNTPATFSSLK